MTQRCSGPQCHSPRSHECPGGGVTGNALHKATWEREGAYVDILLKDVICAKRGEENTDSRAWGGVNSFLHLCWQGEERDSLNHSAGPQASPQLQVPSHSLSRAPAASSTPEPKTVLGHIGLEPASSHLISPSSHSTPLLFFQEREKCPRVTAL